MTTALEGGEGSLSHPGRSLPPGKTRYPLYRRLGGPQGRSGQVRKISPPPGFDPRTFQPVASRYTDWTIPAHLLSFMPRLIISNIKYSHLPVMLLFIRRWFSPLYQGEVCVLDGSIWPLKPVLVLRFFAPRAFFYYRIKPLNHCITVRDVWTVKAEHPVAARRSTRM